MRDRRLLFDILVIILSGLSSTTATCDMAISEIVNEGNIGQTETFNWLGVLRVHLQDVDSVKVAVTGIVLIKIKYAIANADDIVRIPQRIFELESQAMFLAGNGIPWYVPPVSYITHPEYERATYNSIALIKLNLDAVEDYPLKPICYPTAYFNTSHYLYLTGYTDENKILEKAIYKIKYLSKADCEEFYHRAGLSDKKHLPNAYICGYSPSDSTQCVWDNGMALVSNASGWFTLIGFGVRGPGCASPARFIDIYSYLPWINSVTSPPEEINDSTDYRRKDDTEYVPAHELFMRNGSEPYQLQEKQTIIHDYVSYPFDVEKPKMFNIEPFEEDAIAILPFNTTLNLYMNSCSADSILMYREYFELRAPGDSIGRAVYKLTMYDLLRKECTCVKLSIDSLNRDEAILSFREDIHFNLATQLGESGETPEELFRYYPLNRQIKPKEWTPYANVEPKYLHSDIKTGTVWNYELYIKFEFIAHALLKFEILGKAEVPTSTTTKHPKLRQGPERKENKNREWGMVVNRRVKEPGVTLVAQPDLVQQATVSKGYCVKPIFATVLYALGQLAIRISRV